jgi:hypothetical protein
MVCGLVLHITNSKQKLELCIDVSDLADNHAAAILIIVGYGNYIDRVIPTDLI